jgi:aspartyl-tRNA(Asn)/glutamyl-tRNA(Gln) amidotransferase subunit A
LDIVANDHIFITPIVRAGDGPTVAVKDLFDTAGVRTTYGSAIFRDHVPDATATAVARLEAAGYVNAGKANLHEFAWGITSENEHYGWVPNPLAPGRIAGGSSGGSAAALAAGLVDAGLGTDSGGSIRIPAACCGVTGFKPTYGLVPLDGCFPLAPSYDHAGPLARDVAGCEQMMAALVPGFTPVELTVDELRIGVAWTAAAEPLVRRRVEEAAMLLARAQPIEMPLPPAAAYPGFQREAAAVHESLWRDHRELYGENVATKLERALRVSDEEVERAARERELYRERVAGAMARLDLLLTPTLAMVAPPSGVGDLALRDDMLRFTLPWNAVGAPALALPCGPADIGLPASVQLIGRPGDDALVLAAGRALEERLSAQTGGGSR